MALSSCHTFLLVFAAKLSQHCHHVLSHVTTCHNNILYASYVLNSKACNDTVAAMLVHVLHSQPRHETVTTIAVHVSQSPSPQGIVTPMVIHVSYSNLHRGTVTTILVPVLHS